MKSSASVPLPSSFYAFDTCEGPQHIIDGWRFIYRRPFGGAKTARAFENYRSLASIYHLDPYDVFFTL